MLLIAQETPAATEAVVSSVKTPLLDLLKKETPAATPLEAILVPATPVSIVPESTAPAVIVSGVHCNVTYSFMHAFIVYVCFARVRYVQL